MAAIFKAFFASYWKNPRFRCSASRQPAVAAQTEMSQKQPAAWQRKFVNLERTTRWMTVQKAASIYLHVQYFAILMSIIPQTLKKFLR